MYEVYLERTAERDLRKLSENVFQRVISHLKDWLLIPNHQGAVKSRVLQIIGASGLEIIE